MKKLIFCLAIMMVSLNAHAEFHTSTIVSVAMHYNNSIFVRTKDSINPAGCSSNSFTLSQNLPNFKHLYSLAVIASTTGQKVRFGI